MSNQSELALIVIGGSHRAIKRTVDAFIRAAIPHKWCGPVSINSMRHHYVVPTRCLEQIMTLNVGATKSRTQWDWLATTTEASYFRKEDEGAS